jgi:glycosyltransferase involved in cell wall biosynthesis
LIARLEEIDMRVAVIGPVYPYRGGIAHYTGQLIRALYSAGHTVETVSFKRQYPDWLYPGATDKDPSQPTMTVEAEYILDPLRIWTWKQAVERISKQKPDLVVIQWWTTFWGPAFAWLGAALRRRSYKVIYIIHNVLPHEQRIFDPWLACLALRRGSAFIAQTEREKGRLLALLPGRRVEVCPLPIYSLLDDQQIPKAEARRRLGLLIDRPLIIFFGIVRSYKGLKYLIEAMAQLGETDNYPNLLVAGEIWEGKEEYRKLIEHLGLQERVRLEDRYVPDEEAAVMLSAADMLVAPYVDGTQSAAVGMGLGFGLPLVVTDVVAGGIAPEHQGNLRVVPARDATALAGAIQKMLTHTEVSENKRLSAEADWQRLVSKLEELA